MYKNFENKNIHYTFCTPFESENTTLINMAKERGDEIVAYNYKFESKFRKVSIYKAANDILRKNKFDVIHIQSISLLTLLIVAKTAKKYGIKKIIVHSHCAGADNWKYRLIKKYSDNRIEKYVDEFFGCSHLAASWKFPKHVIDKHNYTVINNGIDIKRFTFDVATRQEYRKMLGITNELTICNVARFAYEKNHKFILLIADALHLKNIDFKFIFVGAGSLKDEIIKAFKEKGLIDRAIFLENRSDVAEIVMASDVFVLPSLFEGFPVTLVEAQATGIFSLGSDLITRESIITDICEYLPITDAGVWADKIIELQDKTVEREKYAKVVAEAGYDASESAKLLEDKYLGVK